MLEGQSGDTWPTLTALGQHVSAPPLAMLRACSAQRVHLPHAFLCLGTARGIYCMSA